MNKPYIICHMMSSVDGRIDCKMTEELPGVEEYYKTLDSFAASTSLSGRNTAEIEMSLPGEFVSKDKTSLNKEDFYKATSSNGYEIVVDTKGKLLWNDQGKEEKPLLILTSEKVSIDYLEYLKRKHISWVACGKETINLRRACEILANEFGVKRMSVVGGGHINGGFLQEGLIDEVSILIGAGIDGREDMCSVFDGMPVDKSVTKLKLIDVRTFSSGAVWLRYKVI